MPAGGRNMLKFAPFTTLLLLILAPSLLAEKSKCDVCKDMTKHFMEHFNKTKGHNFGGGNTAWEEKSLGTYATSETRLVEIQEKTAKKCDYKCGSLLEDQEEFLEEWFFKRQDKTDLFEELCVDHLKRCCLENRWGTDCKECPGGVVSPCSGKGRCLGEGSRDVDKQAGTCQCNNGYNGTLCDSCRDRYVRVGEDCEECSKLCKSQKCTAPGPKGCVECRMGYEMLEETGCTDINECEREGMGCGDPLENCVNSAGSYECVCKKDYKRVDGKCQLEDLYASEDEEDEPTEGAETKEIESKDEGDGKLPDEGSEEGDDFESDDYEEVIEPEKSGDVEPKISVDDSINYSETEASGKDEL
ncbi:hypothetical protein ACHWQZ_G011606 [Mnemiopsis leidyi]